MYIDRDDIRQAKFIVDDKREKERLRELERQKQAEEEAGRLALRDQPQAGYVPPTSIDELLARFDRGERHFAGARLAGCELANRTLSHVNFDGADLAGARIQDCKFEKCSFKRADANAATLSGCAFDLPELAKFSVKGASLVSTTISQAALRDVDFSGASLRKLVLDNCRELPASFRQAEEFVDCELSSCQFQGGDFSHTEFLRLKVHAVDFSGADFSWAVFTEAHLDHANFSKAKFEGANLAGARMPNAVFAGSSIKDAKELRGVVWADTNLSECDLSGKSFKETDFSNVKAENADFSDCNLQDAKFIGANLHGAIFHRADLQFSDWKDARLNSADFESADLRRVRNILFDRNNLYTAKLSPKSADPWTQLRRQYSGSRLAFHMLILVAFFLPYVIRTSVWSQVNQVQSAHGELLATLQAHPETSKAINLAAVLTPEVVRVASSPCLAAECKPWRVWELLVARNVSLPALALACLLLVYNGARLYLTWRVGPLRDDEDRTYVTPAAADYRLLFGAHRLVQVVFFVSMASLVFHAWNVLVGTIVYLPA